MQHGTHHRAPSTARHTWRQLNRSGSRIQTDTATLNRPSGVVTLSHSHLVVQHLMKQMESWQPGQNRRDSRPEWLTGLIEELADIFEPLTGIARVGFDSRLEEESWVVRMYLGATEIVGGPRDGQTQSMPFELDLQRLVARFKNVDEFFWSVFPESAADVDEAQAYITISGKVDDHPVRFHMFAVPPEDVGPGMRVYPDGRFDPV